MRAVSDEVSAQSSSIEVSEMVSWRDRREPAVARRAERERLLGVRPVADRAEHLRPLEHELDRPADDLRAASAASTTCDQAEPLQPKPPPTNGRDHVTFSGAMPKIFASVVLHAADVLGRVVQVSRSPSQSATVACGSIGLWCSIGVV